MTVSRIAYIAIVTLSLLFLGAPLIAVWPLAFNTSTFLGYPLEGVTLRWFVQVVSDSNWLQAAANSLMIATLSTFFGVVIGGSAALGTHMSGRLTTVVLTALFMSPIIVPTVVIGLGIFYFFSRLGVGGNIVSLALAHAVLGAPLVFISVLTSLRGIPDNIDLAGASLGASRWHRFKDLTLPLALPGFAIGALFAFMTSFDEVVVTLFLAEPGTSTLPVMLFANLRDKLEPSIIAVSIMLSLFSIAFLLLAKRLQAKTAT